MLHKLKALFKSLQENDARYLVIGGIAVALYGVPPNTFDTDITIEATLENAGKILRALKEAGFATADLIDAAGLLRNEVTIFDDFVQVDVQTRTPGLEFGSAWSRREMMQVQGQPFYVVSKQDLIASKRAAGRPVDLEDVRLLELE
ncbi:hypothetical protein LLG95_11945 [bacterium]|nr:hypothetical protein [bacterium]